MEFWRVFYYAVVIVGYREVVDGVGVRYEYREIIGYSGRIIEFEVVG